MTNSKLTVWDQNYVLTKAQVGFRMSRSIILRNLSELCMLRSKTNLQIAQSCIWQLLIFEKSLPYSISNILWLILFQSSILGKMLS